MSFEVEYFTLESVDATNEYVSLSGTPIISTNVALDIISGTAQLLTDGTVGDFGMDGTKVIWDSTSYTLNGQLVIGDKLRVIYDKS